MLSNPVMLLYVVLAPDVTVEVPDVTVEVLGVTVKALGVTVKALDVTVKAPGVVPGLTTLLLLVALNAALPSLSVLRKATGLPTRHLHLHPPQMVSDKTLPLLPLPLPLL